MRDFNVFLTLHNIFTLSRKMLYYLVNEVLIIRNMDIIYTNAFCVLTSTFNSDCIVEYISLISPEVLIAVVICLFVIAIVISQN